MATKKPAVKAPLPYDKKLVTAWKNVGQAAAEKGYASIAKVQNEPGTWLALEAAIDAGSFPLEAAIALGWGVCNHLPTRFFKPIVSTAPPRPIHYLQAYEALALLGARALREDPAALAEWRDPGDEGLRDAVAMCLAQAGVKAPVAPDLRARIAKDVAAGAATPPSLAVRDGVVERIFGEGPEAYAAMDTSLRRIFGETLEDEIAAALRVRLAEHTAVAGQPYAHALFPQDDTIRIGGTRLTPAEVCGFQVRFPTLQALSSAWSVDAMLEAAEATRGRNRPDAHLLLNSLAVLAIARDPASAPRAEAFLNLFDLTHQTSPSPPYVFEALRRAPADWIRRWATEAVFGTDGPGSVFSGAMAAILLAGVDPEAAEAIVASRDDLHFWRMTGFDASLVEPLLERAGPATRAALDDVLKSARR